MSRLVIGTLALLAPLWGQTQSSLTGYVFDPRGWAVAGARVRLAYPATGLRRDTVTDRRGRYCFLDVDSGAVTVSAAAEGFAAQVITGLPLRLGQSERLDFHLPLGSRRQRVLVLAHGAPLPRANGMVSYRISGRQMRALPQDGRDFVTLALLLPGTVNWLALPPHKGTDAVSISVNGMRYEEANWLIDGGQDRNANEEAALDTTPSSDAIREVQVDTANYSAAYGTAGSTVINVGLKRGGNRWHGSAYEFLRNQALDGNNPEANARGLGRVPLHENTFGLTLGGPLRRARDFIFASVDIRPWRDGQILRTHTPSAAERAGDFSEWLANNGLKSLALPRGMPSFCLQSPTQLNPACFNPQALLLLNSGIFPAANTTLSGFDNFQQSYSQPTNYHEEILRYDRVFNDGDRLTAHYIHDGVRQTPLTTAGASDNFPTVTSTESIGGQSILVRLTQAFGPTFTNELNFNVGTDRWAAHNLGLTASPAGYDLALIYPGKSATQIPALNFSQGYGSYDAGVYPAHNHEELYTLADTATSVAGRQIFRYGGLVQYQVETQDSKGETQGRFYFLDVAGHPYITGNAFADFLLGVPLGYEELSQPQAVSYRYEQFEGFLQDDFQVSPRLALNLGVRYYLIPPAYEARNQLATFVPGAFSAAQAPQLDSQGDPIVGSGNPLDGIVLAGAGVPRGISPTRFQDWAPRLGFAWTPRSGRTVLRGGVGVTYFREPVAELGRTASNPPFSSDSILFLPNFSHPAGAPNAPLGAPGLTVIDPGNRPSTTINDSLTIEHDFSARNRLTIGYVGVASHHLLEDVDLNQPVPVPGYNFNPCLSTGACVEDLYRPYPGWGSIDDLVSDANASYNSLQARWRWQVPGFWFEAAYTWSHDLDNADCFHCQVQNSLNRRGDWGPAQWNHPQTLMANFRWRLPRFAAAWTSGWTGSVLQGWSFAGIVSDIAGGTLPIEATLPGPATRPDQIAPVTYPGTAAEWFSTSSFALPTPGFFGDAQRNSLRGPGGQINLDCALSKSVVLGEGRRLELRAEAFNAFNEAQPNQIDTRLGDANFGQITGYADGREIQLGARLTF